MESPGNELDRLAKAAASALSARTTATPCRPSGAKCRSPASATVRTGPRRQSFAPCRINSTPMLAQAKLSRPSASSPSCAGPCLALSYTARCSAVLPAAATRHATPVIRQRRSDIGRGRPARLPRLNRPSNRGRARRSGDVRPASSVCGRAMRRFGLGNSGRIGGLPQRRKFRRPPARADLDLVEQMTADHRHRGARAAREKPGRG